jgi:hypothetical protein
VKTHFQAFIAMLFITVVLYGQKSANAEQEKPVATVIGLEGSCYVQDAQARPQKIQLKDELRADHEVFCDLGAQVKIRYKSSSGEKEIKSRPTWEKIGNASTRPPGKNNLGGRDAMIERPEAVKMGTGR